MSSMCWEGKKIVVPYFLGFYWYEFVEEHQGFVGMFFTVFLF